MKLKKVLKKLGEAGLICIAALFARTLYKAKQFKVSCDINQNALDTVSIMDVKSVTFAEQKMKDFKLGAFLGILNCDISDLNFEQREYDLTLEIEQGKITLIIPETVGLNITSLQSTFSIIDERPIIKDHYEKILAVHADIHFGILVIKNEQ